MNSCEFLSCCSQKVSSVCNIKCASTGLTSDCSWLRAFCTMFAKSSADSVRHCSVICSL
jgi:hypothetical protein